MRVETNESRGKRQVVIVCEESDRYLSVFGGAKERFLKDIARHIRVLEPDQWTAKSFILRCGGKEYVNRVIYMSLADTDEHGFTVNERFAPVMTWPNGNQTELPVISEKETVHLKNLNLRDPSGKTEESWFSQKWKEFKRDVHDGNPLNKLDKFLEPSGD